MGLKCKRAINRLMHKAQVTMAKRMGVIATSQQQVAKAPEERFAAQKTIPKVNVPEVPKTVLEQPKTPNNGTVQPKKVITLPKR